MVPFSPVTTNCVLDIPTSPRSAMVVCFNILSRLKLVQVDNVKIDGVVAKC